MPMSESSPTPSLRRISCADLREWVMKAQCGAVLPYARGYALKQNCSDELRKYVLTLHEQGYVIPHLQRETAAEGGSIRYLVRRSGEPVAKGARL